MAFFLFLRFYFCRTTGINRLSYKRTLPLMSFNEKKAKHLCPVSQMRTKITVFCSNFVKDSWNFKMNLLEITTERKTPYASLMC